MLMRHYMTEVSFKERGNRVAMTKVFRAIPAATARKRDERSAVGERPA